MLFAPNKGFAALIHSERKRLRQHSPQERRSEFLSQPSGVLHTDFPPGFTPVSQDNSFKSRDEAGNIQFTFASNSWGRSSRI